MNNEKKTPINEGILFSVILPTYNERNNIVPLMDAVLKTVSNVEVIVVDDNSPDGTWDIVCEYGKKHPQVRLIHRLHQKGLVSALKEGINTARGEIVGWMDCDLSMPPALYAAFLNQIAGGYDVCVGSRFVKGGGVELLFGSSDTVTAYVLSALLNRFCQCMLGRDFKDYTSGFIAIKKSMLEHIRIRGDYGEYFIELIHQVRQKGCRIVEIPYVSKSRLEGESKTGTTLFHYLKRGMKYIWVICRCKFTRIK